MAKPIDSWETIVKASELPSRSIKHVEIKEKEIAEINLDGNNKISTTVVGTLMLRFQKKRSGIYREMILLLLLRFSY